MSAPKREKAAKQELPERAAILMPEGVEMRLLGHWAVIDNDEPSAVFPVDITADGQRWVFSETDKEGRWVYQRSTS